MSAPQPARCHERRLHGSRYEADQCLLPPPEDQHFDQWPIVRDRAPNKPNLPVQQSAPNGTAASSVAVPSVSSPASSPEPTSSMSPAPEEATPPTQLEQDAYPTPFNTQESLSKEPATARPASASPTAARGKRQASLSPSLSSNDGKPLSKRMRKGSRPSRSSGLDSSETEVRLKSFLDRRGPACQPGRAPPPPVLAEDIQSYNAFAEETREYVRNFDPAGGSAARENDDMDVDEESEVDDQMEIDVEDEVDMPATPSQGRGSASEAASPVVPSESDAAAADEQQDALRQLHQTADRLAPEINALIEDHREARALTDRLQTRMEVNNAEIAYERRQTDLARAEAASERTLAEAAQARYHGARIKMKAVVGVVGGLIVGTAVRQMRDS